MKDEDWKGKKLVGRKMGFNRKIFGLNHYSEETNFTKLPRVTDF